MNFRARDLENSSISKLFAFNQNPIMTPAKGCEFNFAQKSESKQNDTINDDRIKKLGKDMKCTSKPSFCELFNDLKNAINDDIKPFPSDYKSFGESIESNLNFLEEPLSWNENMQHSHLDDQTYRIENISQDANFNNADKHSSKTSKREAKANSKLRDDEQAKSILQNSDVGSKSKGKKKASKNTVSFTNVEDEEKQKQATKTTKEVIPKRANNRKRGRSTISRLQNKGKNNGKQKKNQQESRMKVIDITEENDLIGTKKSKNKKNRRLTILIQKSPVKSKCEIINENEENEDQEMVISPERSNEDQTDKQSNDISNHNLKKGKISKKESRFELNGIFGNIIMEDNLGVDVHFYKNSNIFSINIHYYQLLKHKLKCCVCLKSSKDLRDKKQQDAKHIDILLCNLCKLAVHSECYYGEKISKSNIHDPWECERCIHCVVNKQIPEDVKCKLCPNISGALRKLNGKQYFNEFKKKTRSNKEKDSENIEIQWAHVVCLIWIEELSKLAPANYMNAKGSSKSKPETLKIDLKKDCDSWRLGYKCRVCETKTGALIKCSEPSCRRKFHVTCAIQDRLITKKSLPYDLFCKSHKSEITEIKLSNECEQAGSTGYSDHMNIPTPEPNIVSKTSSENKKRSLSKNDRDQKRSHKHKHNESANVSETIKSEDSQKQLNKSTQEKNTIASAKIPENLEEEILQESIPATVQCNPSIVISVCTPGNEVQSYRFSANEIKITLNGNVTTPFVQTQNESSIIMIRREECAAKDSQGKKSANTSKSGISPTVFKQNKPISLEILSKQDQNSNADQQLNEYAISPRSDDIPQSAESAPKRMYEIDRITKMKINSLIS